ncbi:tail collar domain containing protein [Synechococcus phage S-H34]|uniref:Tail collar domain containing protein n=1 Tax=Synechococcus phage S-H34 TaxID=2718942 RepID=A0A6G8R6Y5_9CAUD|nr:tail fiber protein; Ig-domain containing [Synechococcus phage S-H34]QIN96920.1 tail collar domain containing protein [Synechococcus phage S-H34]
MALNFPSDTSNPYIDPSSGLKYIFNASIGAWEAAIQPPAIVSATQPDITIEGFFWWDSINNVLNVYENGQWVTAGQQGGGSTTVTVGSTPPGAPTGGDLWWDTVSGRLFIYYTDVDSSQWMDASPNLAGSNGGGVVAGNSAPANAVEGDLWYNTLNDTLNIYHNNVWETTQNTVAGVATLSSTTPITLGGTASDPVVGVSNASNSALGVVRLATQSEANTGTSTTAALTPGTLTNAIDNYLPAASDVQAGVVELATSAEIIAGTETDKAMTPAAYAASISSLGIGNPPGTVITFAGSTAPTGYLACSGQQVDRVTYADLFAAVGTVFGVGDGTTTFNLPDLRGEFVRGWDNGRGIDSGRAFGSTQNSANLAHSHTITDPGHQHNATLTDDTRNVADGGVTGGNVPTTAVTDNAVTGITVDSDGGTEARPRNIALLYCIKF